MKGVILAGGNGTRLQPLTLVTNKQLLPVYHKPMIYYPLNLLIKAGIKDVLIITSPRFAGDYLRLFESGRKMGIKVTYAIQESPDGLAHGLSLAEDFADGEPVTMVLGDNIISQDVSDTIRNFDGNGAISFFIRVPDASRFGCPVFDENGKLTMIEEKQKEPKSEYAQIGIYVYDKTCFDKIRVQKPSPRGELEITDLNNVYLKEGNLKYEILDGHWFDAGTFESLFEANEWAREEFRKNNDFISF